MSTPLEVLSDPAATLVPMFHPWRILRGRQDITLVAEAEDGRLSSWCERTRKLRYDPRQSQAERRCSITHELIHEERGDTECDPSVHREAARRLIRMQDLATAMLAHGEDWPRVADELWVDDDTLEVRLASLHPAERGYLLRRLSMKEHSA